jgi:dTDP-4-dehydrorhamnose 3,5-epimerase
MEKFGKLSNAWTLKSPKYDDLRGFFVEVYREVDFSHLGIQFVQDGLSVSKSGVRRGMHFQKNQYQLVTLVSGRIMDVVLDVNPNSSTFGHFESVVLTENDINQLLLSPGLAHGFLALEPSTVYYKTSEMYDPRLELGVSAKSSLISHIWPDMNILESDKDRSLELFEDHSMREQLTHFFK